MVVPPSPDETARMARIAAGDRAAFQELYEAHAPAVMSLLYHLTHDRGLAEDLTQETFLRAWRAAPRWKPRAPVRTWLMTIARRRGWDEGRRRRLRRAVWGTSLPGGRGLPETSAIDPGRSPAEGAEALLERQEEASRARDLVRALPPRLRIVFVLVRLLGTDPDEAARIVRVPAGTVKSRLHAAEARLRAAMEVSAGLRGKGGRS
jgi:RNA polymerase sigma-70 factor (ECF subfamily)